MNRQRAARAESFAAAASARCSGDRRPGPGNAASTPSVRRTASASACQARCRPSVPSTYAMSWAGIGRPPRRVMEQASYSGRNLVLLRDCAPIRLANAVPVRGSAVISHCGVRFHGLDQAVRPHVGPVFLDEVEALLTAVFPEDNFPALGYVGENWPQRMLSLVVDQNEIPGFLVLKRVRRHR